MAKKTFLLSDETINAYGYRILTDGIVLDVFEQNPVMLDMHQRGLEHVIGRWENLVKKDGKLFADAVFDLRDEKGAMVGGKVERGFVNSCSVGLQILEYIWEEDIMVVTKCLLLEVSIVDIPANRSAYRLFDQSGKELNLSGTITLSDIFKPVSTPQNNNTEMDKKKLAAKLNLSEDASDAAIEAALTAKLSQADSVATLTKELSTLKTKEIEGAVDKAIADGKITKESRDAFVSLGQTGGIEALQGVIGGIATQATPATTTKTTTPPPTPPAPLNLSDAGKGKDGGQQAKGREEWDYKKWSKEDPTGLKKLAADDWEAYSEVYKRSFGVEPKR